MELIDKAAIVAEIESRIKERDNQMKSGYWVSSTYIYEDLLDFLDTLEAKDVDLEKENLPISNSLTEEGLLTFEDGSQAITRRIN